MKSNGTYCGQLNTRGFEYIAGKHFDPASTAAPVTKNTTIKIVLLLILLADRTARIYEVKGTFLKGQFEKGEEIFLEVPQGMDHFYWGSSVLRLLKPIYRLKQAVLLFW